MDSSIAYERSGTGLFLSKREIHTKEGQKLRLYMRDVERVWLHKREFDWICERERVCCFMGECKSEFDAFDSVRESFNSFQRGRIEGEFGFI